MTNKEYKIINKALSKLQESIIHSIDVHNKALKDVIKSHIEGLESINKTIKNAKNL